MPDQVVERGATHQLEEDSVNVMLSGAVCSASVCSFVIDYSREIIPEGVSLGVARVLESFPKLQQ